MCLFGRGTNERTNVEEEDVETMGPAGGFPTSLYLILLSRLLLGPAEEGLDKV